MRGRGRTVAIVAAIVGVAGVLAGAVVAATRSSDESALAAGTARPPTAASSARSTSLLAQDDASTRSCSSCSCSRTARSPTPTPRPAWARSSASPTRRRSTTSSTSRSSSRGCTSRSSSPTTRSTATARSSRSRWAPRAASTRRWPRPTTRSPRARPPPSASSRSTARWSTSRTSRAGAGSPRPRARTPTSARSSRPRASRPRRARLLGARQGRHQRQALRRLRPARGRPRVQHDRHVRAAAAQPLPAAVQGRGRRRRRHRRCARSTRSAASRAAPTPELETDILKKEWGFDGFIESDYTAVAELRACPPQNPDEGPCGHGVAADGPDAAQAALNAGTDSEMVSTNIRDFGKQLLAQRRISMARIDDAVRRILRVKFRAGLFDHPYVDQAKAVDPASFVTADDRAAARGGRGQVDGPAQERRPTLPLDTDQVDGGDRPAGQQQARHARPVVGPGRRRRRRVACSTASRPQSPRRPSPRAAPSIDKDPPDLHPGRRVRLRRRLRGGGRRGRKRRPGRPRPRRDPRAERRGRLAQRDRPPRRAAGADRRDQGDRQAVRRRALQRPPADADEGRRVLAGDPRGLVPGHRGRQRRGRRAVRQGQPRRQAAGVVPARRSARCRSTTTTSRPAARATSSRSTTRATATCRLRRALPVRLRAELHDVHGREPAAQHATACRPAAS